MGSWLAHSAAVAGVLVLLPFGLGDFAAYELALYFLYAIAALGVGLCWGSAGFLPLGQAMFVGIGGYLSGLALIPTYTEQANALVPVGILALALLLYVFFFPGRKEAQAIAAEEEAEAAAAEAEEAARGQVIDLGSRRRQTGN